MYISCPVADALGYYVSVLIPLIFPFYLLPQCAFQSHDFKYHLNPEEPLQILISSYELLFEFQLHFHLDISNSTNLKSILIFRNNLILSLIFPSQ